jgi:hypothetical protein
MKNRFKLGLVSCGLLFASIVQATTYTVKPSGGNFQTVNACAQQAVAGDTCVIYAGAYNETVTPKNSGTPANQIVYKTNPGDQVSITGFNLQSLNYITVTGSQTAPLQILQAITWQAITHMTFQYIADTSGFAGSCFGGNGWYSSQTPSSYNRFLNITTQYCGGKTNNSSGAFELEGDHNLFDSINVQYSQAAVTISGVFNVIRNSSFGPTSVTVIGSNHSQPLENSVACGGSSSDIPGGMQHLLYENNYSSQWRGGNSHATALITDTGSVKCGTTMNVFRYNQSMDSGSYTTEIYSSLNSYFYNNSFSNTQLDNSPKDKEDYQFSPSAPNSRTINNIFANTTQVGSQDWCIYAVTPLVENHNLCFNTGWTGGWSGPTTGSSNTYDMSDVFNKDPLFVNPDTDLHIKAGSPASQTGGPLTVATNSGSNVTTLTVADAGFFSDGYGIQNVQPDWIQVNNIQVQIAAVNYQTNTLTLTTPISWPINVAVYLYKNSSGAVVLHGMPDIGAFSITGQPAPPTNLKAVPN